MHRDACTHRFVIPDAFRPERRLVTVSPSGYNTSSPVRAPTPSHSESPPPSSSASREKVCTVLNDDEKELAIMIAI